MKKRMMLIINPMAGRSGYKNGFGEVMNILDSGGYLTTVYFTQGRGDATLMAAQHAAEYDTVACIGGDGTLSEGVSGLIEFDEIGDAKRDAAYIKAANTESGEWEFVKVQGID